MSKTIVPSDCTKINLGAPKIGNLSGSHVPDPLAGALPCVQQKYFYQPDHLVCHSSGPAYFMVPMSKEDRQFLQFQWKDKPYQFNCLPFGLSSAPSFFTKIPVVATLRELGLHLIIYIDDILVIAETESMLRDHIMGVVFLLEIWSLSSINPNPN